CVTTAHLAYRMLLSCSHYQLAFRFLCSFPTRRSSDLQHTPIWSLALRGRVIGFLWLYQVLGIVPPSLGPVDSVNPLLISLSPLVYPVPLVYQNKDILCSVHPLISAAIYLSPISVEIDLSINGVSAFPDHNRYI